MIIMEKDYDYNGEGRVMIIMEKDYDYNGEGL